jgi:hypothetical protein
MLSMAGKVVGSVTFKGAGSGVAGGVGIDPKVRSAPGVLALQAPMRATIRTIYRNQEYFFISFPSFLKRAQGARFKAKGKNVMIFSDHFILAPCAQGY